MKKSACLCSPLCRGFLLLLLGLANLHADTFATTPAVTVTTPAPVATTTSTDDPVLTRQILALKLVWDDVQASTTGSDQRRGFLEEFMAKSALLLRALPVGHAQTGWCLSQRVVVALELNHVPEATDAGTKLLELGFDSSSDELVQKSLVILERKGLLRIPQKVVPEKIVQADAVQVEAAQVEAARWVAETQADNAKLSAAIGIELVAIPAGSFVMSSPASEVGRFRDEGPQTKVIFSRPFWIGKYEITQAEWRLLMPKNPSLFKGERLPVENVSWDDAMAFCQKLTARERAAGHLPDGYVFTLPTEAQWEYACRAGRTSAYAGDLDSMAWYVANSLSSTHEVGKRLPNAWGLHDVHGNVWEWCSDWYVSGFPGGTVTDPTGAPDGTARVARGGGWYDVAVCSRSSCRGYSSPDFHYGNLGLRIALISTNPVP